MRSGKLPEDVTLLDILVDGFEKNEVLDGFHWRTLPMPDEAAAVRKYAALANEGERWKGQPTRRDEQPERRITAWADLEIRQAGRGIMVRARAPWFATWWHDAATWRDDPMDQFYEWLEQERSARPEAT